MGPIPKPIKPTQTKNNPIKTMDIETEDDKLVTDYDDLSDTDLTLGETTDQHDSEDELPTNKSVNNTVIVRHESVRSDMTSESDWNMPSNAVTIKPNSIK